MVTRQVTARAVVDGVDLTASASYELVEAPAPNMRRSLSGVRVFPHYENVYGNYPKILAAISELGVGHVSGQLAIDKPSSFEFYRQAFETYGIRCRVTVGQPREVLTAAQWDKVDAALAYLGPAVELTMNWNEPNHMRNANDVPLTNWVRDTVDHQKKLAAHSRAAGVPCGTSQLWSGDVDTQYADLSKLVAAGMTKADYDVIVWHLYPRGADTQAKITSFYNTQEAAFRSRLNDQTSPVYGSEWGYFTAPNYTGGAQPVTEQVRADRIPWVANWYTSRGYGQSYFELWNDPNPAGDNREAWLGLVWADGTRTLGFKSYRDWLAAGS